MIERLLSLLTYALTSLIGIVAFLYPFWLPSVSHRPSLPSLGMMGQAHASDATLLLTILVFLCFAVLLLEVQRQAINTKTVALLGILVAINATLRYVDNLLPIPGGFSPIFLLIVLTGYVYGGRLGFLLGALTLLVSALITGGVGPWLPYQMFTAGWVGMTAPLCRWLIPNAGRGRNQWELIVLAIFSGGWGLLYGAIMNLWFWPFATGDPTQYWQPGITPLDTLQRYALFYVTTSLFWDAARLAGNVLLLLALGAPILRGLRRFHARFDFVYQPLIVAPSPILTPEQPLSRL
ncbi:MAG: ECF transporter S component [Caldilineaceae bacterium]|nr:ECF transporter S component [Caldilineaceae bacterium]